MKQLIIIGAGGMGRTFYSNALESRGFGEEFVVKGFIDDNLQALDGFAGYPPILGTIRDYVDLILRGGPIGQDGPHLSECPAGQG